MPRYHRYGPRLIHRGHPFRGMFWLVGLGILFFAGHWWPFILILIGISMLFSEVWKESDAQTLPGPETRPQSTPPAAPVWTMPASIPVPPTPISNPQRLDILPSNCPRCGAPVRSNEVKWTGSHSAACSYCGSTLPVTKSA